MAATSRRRFNAEGMTGLKDPGIVARRRGTRTSGSQPTATLTVRVFALWQAGDSIEARAKLIARARAR